MKIAIIIGTRPEIIKMAPLLELIDNKGLNNILIHMGQHYDHEMSQQFFIDLELKEPDFNVGVGSGSHGKQTATMIKSIEEILLTEKPDIVMVEGDTNTVLAGAIASSKLNIAAGHVEAGLRSYDKTMPEEINRLIADICSTMFFVPTEESAMNLLFENVNPHEIFITGNTIVDACIRHLEIAKRKSSILSELNVSGDILTLTMHRAENVDDPERLGNIIDALVRLEDITVIFPMHPRTVKALKKFGFYNKLEHAPHIKLTKPLGYLDFLLLLSKSKFVMTDSGGLQEEAITLNIPCMTLRYNTERPETVKAGGNILVGAETDKILKTFNHISSDPALYKRMKQAQNPYGDGRAAENILKSIMDFDKAGKFDINAPKQIAGHVERKFLDIHDDLSVLQYEAMHPGSRVMMVLHDHEIKFPYPDLNLKDKQVVMLIQES